MWKENFALGNMSKRPTPLTDIMDDELKWHIIQVWKEVKDLKKVAHLLGLRKRAVQRWVQRYQETGSVQQLPKPGRPPLLDGAAERAAVDLLLSAEHGTAGKAAHALLEGGLVSKLVHKTTVIRHAAAAAKQQGEPIRAVRGLPARQLSSGNKDTRLVFARTNKKRNWKHVMFSDRKKFQFSYPGASVKAMKWVRKGKQYTAPRVNHALVVNLYAGITPYGVTECHLVAGTSKLKSTFNNTKGGVAKSITKSEYEHVLEHTFLPEGNRIFSLRGVSPWYLQQDNDPAHKKAAISVVSRYNKQHGTHIRLLEGWPPNSPDLSPIENVWGIVQAKVNARACHNFEEFQQVVLDEFKALPKNVLTNLYSSMSGRMEKCIAAGGDKINY
jgi:hypothetical protein